LTFEDYLLTQPNSAKVYSTIEHHLARALNNDSKGCAEGKASFIQAIEYQAGIASQAQLNAKDDIKIEPYNKNWPQLAEAEIATLKALLPSQAYSDIQHLGSTSVPSLASKPILDIHLSVESINKAQSLIKPIESMGYVRWEECPHKDRLWFGKGIPPFGRKRSHHLHILENNSDRWRSRVLFRDILRNNAGIREQYAVLKKRLSIQYTDDRESYTDAKSDFIRQVLEQAGFSGEVSR